EPLVPAPAHGLPIDYMEGPYRYRGTLRGDPVSGFAFYERTLAMHRDWELVEVLANADASIAEDVRKLVGAGRRDEAIDYLNKVDAPTPEVAQIVADLVTALRTS